MLIFFEPTTLFLEIYPKKISVQVHKNIYKIMNV